MSSQFLLATAILMLVMALASRQAHSSPARRHSEAPQHESEDDSLNQEESRQTISDAFAARADLTSGPVDLEAYDEDETAASSLAHEGIHVAQLAGVDEETGELEGEPIHGLDTNIANAKVELTPNDMATAAGHHHHHKHYVHGKLDMGAHTGKKGAFGWHDKHPVGGKGR